MSEHLKRKILLPALLLAAAVSFTPAANAAGKMVWWAELVYLQYTPSERDYVTTQTYPTKAQALAAMHALLSNDPAANAVTQESTAWAMSSSSITYRYVPPLLLAPLSNWGYDWDRTTSLRYSDEASAVAAYTSAWCDNQPPPCTVTPTSDWTRDSPAPSGGPPAPYDNVDYKTYAVFLSPGHQFGSRLNRVRTMSCPPGYGLTWNDPTVPPTCVDGWYVGYVTGTLLECPDNGSASTQVGDPCDVSTGDFSQTEPDYASAGLSFTRYYHSAVLESHHNMGVGWTHNYAAYLVLSGTLPLGLLRPDGHHDAVWNVNGEYISLSGSGIHIKHIGSNWIATLGDGSSEIYNGTGQLVQTVTAAGLITTLTYNTLNQLASVTGPFGHSLQLGYDDKGRLITVTEPDGTHTVTYAYDSADNLISATYPDGSVRQYLYQNSSFPHNLTGILDESSSQFLTVQYDPTTAAVISSQQAGGAQAVSMAYSANTAVVTDSLGATNIYTFTNDSFAPRVTNLSRNNLQQSFAVPTGATDPQRRVTQSTDANGNVTTYAYDTDHLISKTEAFGTARARTTSYQYLSTSSALPLLVTEALRQTGYTYYSGTNNIHTKTVTDTSVMPNVSRTWTYTYDSSGRVLTADGPRTDVSDITTYAYYTCTTGYQCGQLQTVTNAAGQITIYNTYNAFGQPLTIIDPNGIVTTLAYDAHQRLTSRQVGTETTTFSYWPTGLLKEVTLPDASYLQYTYDGAHRLTQISDALGNKVVYTLDAMGNRTVEKTYDPTSFLHRTHARVINTLDQLYQDVNAAGTAAVTTTFAYDGNGNQTSVAAPLARNTTNTYDELNRLKQVTDPGSGITQFAYDANDNVTSIIDPRTLTTSYAYTGFGDLKTRASPDTGTTTNTYDSGGNLATSNDARGAVSTYTYDVLNRVTSVAYKIGTTTDQTIAFTYDAGTNGLGHLTDASDANHSTTWSYDGLGRVISKGQTLGTVTKSVAYGYTNADLTSMTTPSGQSIAYGYNANHQLTSITLNGTTTVLNNVTYEPLGPINGWRWGNGSATTRTYDADGKLSQISSAGVKTFAYDDAFRLTGVTDTSVGAANWTYGYDLLDRITSGVGGTITRGWTYDANGNRKTETGTAASTYTISTSNNRISSVTGALARTYAYDAAGNTRTYATVTATYNNRGRPKTIKKGSVTETLVYNALGQMIKTSGGAAGTVLYWYDEAGHLLGEYSSTGALVQETIWLGDIPVATLRPSGSTVAVYYVHSDQLNTPREVTRPSDNKQMWAWFADPFGTTAANANPQGAGVFPYNLRFSGQFFDPQAGLHQNTFRDYDPAIGRYIESDPIGLKGGINTYAYALDNPMSNIDPLGLWVKICSRWLGNPTKGSTSRTWNPIRHDYLNVSGQFIGFYSAPGANPAWGRGVVAGQNEQDDGRCSPLCNDDKFDAYVLAAAQEIGAPTYCAIASAEFGLQGLAVEAAGARNCQSWARDVIAKAKKNYLAHENCPKCFK